MMGRTIRGAFAMRRKTLVNSLASEFGELNKEAITEAVIAAGLTPEVRGEKLGIPEFAALADALTAAVAK